MKSKRQQRWMKSSAALLFPVTLLLAAAILSASAVPSSVGSDLGFCTGNWLEQEGRNQDGMATLGGVHEPRGAENSVAVEDLARFAVDEHNKKEVPPFD